MCDIKILLVGYGKMGKMLYENVDYIGGKVVAISDPNITHIPPCPSIQDTPMLLSSIDHPLPTDIDVAIEFSHPDCGYDNVRSLLQQNIPVVTGTTGWFHRIGALREEFSPQSHTLIYGANYSVGMNLFYQIVANAAALIQQTGLYDIYGLEAHHKQKADKPSGTAKVLAEIVEKTSDLIGQTSEGLFTSIRAGSIVGLHQLGFDSDFDEIKLTHNAKTRKGFAIGALLAAKYAINHKGFYDFKDIFQDVLEK